MDFCRYLGQINPTDFFTRLLAGVDFTGLAPASFYQDANGPDRHFDGMCAAHLGAMCTICVCLLPALATATLLTLLQAVQLTLIYL